MSPIVSILTNDCFCLLPFQGIIDESEYGGGDDDGAKLGIFEIVKFIGGNP